MEKNNPWIVDSSASDHMTGNATLFHTYSPSSGNFMVQIADGLFSKVAGIGSVAIINDLILKSILFVPNLTCKLQVVCLSLFFQIYPITIVQSCCNTTD